MSNGILANLKSGKLNPREQQVIHSMYNFADITPDMYYAFYEFIPSQTLSAIVQETPLDSRITKKFIELYQHWLLNIATKEQKELCLFYGIINVNHQIQDIKEVLSSGMVDEYFEQFFPTDCEIKTIPYEGDAIENLITEEVGNQDLEPLINEEPKIISLEELQTRFENQVEVTESVLLGTCKPLIYQEEKCLSKQVNILYKLSTEERLLWLEQFSFLIEEFKKVRPLSEVLENQKILNDKKFEKIKIALKNATNELGILSNSEEENEVYDSKQISLLENQLNIPEKKVDSFVKRSIKKAVKLYNNIFEDNNINLFISGKEFIIEGERFNYSISQSSYSLLEHAKNPNSAHIPYNLMILNKDNVVLCNACVVFPDTPILDQIIGLTLHIKSGNEEEFLNKANFFNKTPDFYHESFFKQKFENEIENFHINNLSENIEKGKRYSELRQLCESAINDIFPIFLGNKTLPKIIKDGKMTWFDEITDLYSVTKDKEQFNKIEVNYV